MKRLDSPSMARVIAVACLVAALAGGGVAATGVGVGVTPDVPSVPAAPSASGDATFSGFVGGERTDPMASAPVDAERTGSLGTDTVTDIDGADTVTGTDDADTIRLRHGLSLIDEPGAVGVTTRATIPDRVTSLELTLRSANDAPVEADGFERATDPGSGEPVWTWDGETERPSLTYAMDANDTVEQAGPIGTGGTYRFVDAGDWALVQTPRTAAAWSYTGQYSGQVRLERETAVDGQGTASQSMAYLGPYEEHVHEGDGGRYRLIVPDAADPVATPEEVFGVFDGAAAALRVGPPDEEVFAVVAPTGDVSWGVRGLQTGDADLWVRDEEPVTTADDVWTHEYVHTRQAYRAEPSGRWITEAAATYYAALFALERGDTDFDAFERTLARGEREPAASSTLADPGTWAGNANYAKGSLVAGELDRRIRIATDGRASLATVLRDLNDAADPITNRDVLNAVESAAAAGGDDDLAAAIRADADRLTTTDTAPRTWDRTAHAEAFGETPARVGYGLAEDGVRATGEYRDRSVDRGPVELVTNETLDLSVLVSNTGGTAGDYRLTLTVDGERIETRAGTIGPGNETVERFERAFDEPGEHEVRLGSETLSVAVTDPAPVLVRDISTDRASIETGESVRATATVVNDAGIPAGGDVAFVVDGERVGTESVRLDANAETTVERDVRVNGSVGSESVTVRAVGPADEASTTVAVTGGNVIDGATDGEVPGFGPVTAIAALLAALAATRFSLDRGSR